VQPVDRSVDAGEALRAEHGQLQARQTVVQRLLRRIARQLDHHFILHEAGFFSRRQVEVATGADVQPGRIVDARNGRRTRTGLRLLLLLLLRLIEELRVEKIGRRRWRIDRIVCQQKQRRLRHGV
jgi:hypothetical protein